MVSNHKNHQEPIYPSTGLSCAQSRFARLFLIVFASSPQKISIDFSPEQHCGMRITRSPFHNPEPPNRPSMRSCQSCQCHPRLRGFSSHQSASRVAQIAHPGVDAFQVVRCRKISGDDLLKKSCDNEADSWLPCWKKIDAMERLLVDRMKLMQG